MRDFEAGDLIDYRTHLNDRFKQSIVLRTEGNLFYVADRIEGLFQPSYIVKMGLVRESTLEMYFVRPFGESKKKQEVICTCTNRAIFHFGCPSARGLACRNGRE